MPNPEGFPCFPWCRCRKPNSPDDNQSQPDKKRMRKIEPRNQPRMELTFLHWIAITPNAAISLVHYFTQFYKLFCLTTGNFPEKTVFFSTTTTNFNPARTDDDDESWNFAADVVRSSAKVADRCLTFCFFFDAKWRRPGSYSEGKSASFWKWSKVGFGIFNLHYTAKVLISLKNLLPVTKISRFRRKKNIRLILSVGAL